MTSPNIKTIAHACIIARFILLAKFVAMLVQVSGHDFEGLPDISETGYLS